MRRSIALIVDHPQRDLAGLVLTAYELCQRGHVCHLVPLNLQDTEVWALAPEFVLVNYLRRFNEPFLRRLVSAGIAYGLLDTEGAVFSSFEEYAELHCTDPALLRGARCACIWGPRLAQWLVAQGVYETERVTVTGCPRFDLYAPVWRSVMLDSAERDASARPRILVNTNFSIVNPRFTSSAENIEVYHAQLGWSRERLAAYTGIEQEAIAATIQLAHTLAARFPACTVVVRPHPHESPEPYRAALARVPNLELNVDGPVQPQIFRAAVVVQRSCTTAVEAALADVPALSARWIVPPVEASMSEAVSVGCESLEAMCARIEEILAGRWTPDTEQSGQLECVIAEWFHRRDGLAFRRVADVVSDALDELGERRVDARTCRRYMYRVYRDERRQAGMSHRLRQGLRLPPHWSFRLMRAVPELSWLAGDKAFHVDEVRGIAARVARAYDDAGWSARPVRVASPSDGGWYSDPRFLGQSVTLTCE